MTIPGPGEGEFSGDTFTLPDNPGERERMRREDWVMLLTQRFGADPMDWAMVCPSCGLVQSARTLEPFGSAVKAQLGQMCAGRFVDGSCTYTTLSPAGGPLSVTIWTDTGRHLKTAMMIAPAGAQVGSTVPEGERP